MHKKIKDTEKTLRELMEHESFSSEEVEYFTQNLSLKPLNIIISRFRENTSKKKFEFVLDAGCGVGLFAFLVYQDFYGSVFSTVGVDLNCKRLKFANIILKASNKTHFVRSSINYLPFKDKTFHVTLVHDVFYQLSYSLVISEIARVTNDFIYFDIPNRFFYILFPFLKPSPLYLTYELSDVREKLSSLNFEIVEIMPAPLLYLTRKLKFPPQIIRPLFNFSSAWSSPLKGNLCKIWPLLLICAKRYIS